MKSTFFVGASVLLVVLLTGFFIWGYAPASGTPAFDEPAGSATTPETDAHGDAQSNMPHSTDSPAANNLENPSQVPQSDALMQDIHAGYLILVNKEHALEADDGPSDLTEIVYFAPDRPAEARYLRKDAADAFHRLVEEAAAEDIVLVLTTGYRSFALQTFYYQRYVDRDGQEAADRYSAQPGKSEHQTGLATDVSGPSVNYALTAAFGESEEGRWLAANAARFGFVVRYPEGKEEITGYIYEPWHIRYVGIPAAAYMFEHALTLEEYLALLDQWE